MHIFILSIRDSRRRMYRKKYECACEVTRRNVHDKAGCVKKQEVCVCSVQEKEVIGVTEIILDLPTHIGSLKCQTECEVYSIAIKPFR